MRGPFPEGVRWCKTRTYYQLLFWYCLLSLIILCIILAPSGQFIPSSSFYDNAAYSGGAIAVSQWGVLNVFRRKVARDGVKGFVGHDMDGLMSAPGF